MWKLSKRSWSFFVTLNRDAALDSLRSVLSLIGFGAVLAYFGTMHLWLMLPALALFFAVWYADYIRHEGL